MKTKEELIQLATDKPEELSLIFAREVAGFLDVEFCSELDKRLFATYPRETIGRVLPDYLTDWTATINAIEKAGMQMVVSPIDYAEVWFNDYETKIQVDHLLNNWAPCIPLIICAILVKQQEKK